MNLEWDISIATNSKKSKAVYKYRSLEFCMKFMKQ